MTAHVMASTFYVCSRKTSVVSLRAGAAELDLARATIHAKSARDGWEPQEQAPPTDEKQTAKIKRNARAKISTEPRIPH